jgi:hypothetical protein
VPWCCDYDLLAARTEFAVHPGFIDCTHRYGFFECSREIHEPAVITRGADNWDTSLGGIAYGLVYVIIRVIAAQTHGDNIHLGVYGIAYRCGYGLIAAHARVAEDFEGEEIAGWGYATAWPVGCDDPGNMSAVAESVLEFRV